MKTYEITEETGATDTVEAESMAEAIELAEDWLRDGDWERDQTIWVSGHVQEVAAYTTEHIEHMDEAIDEFQDAVDLCWSINDIESGHLDSPTPGTPMPTDDAINAAEALGSLRRHMLSEIERCEDRERVSITLDPVPPECEDGEEHDWQSPYSIVGGIKENPGVWGHGGGVIIHEVCVRCGCGKTTDTWAQNPDGGEQGLTSVSYEQEKYTVESVDA